MKILIANHWLKKLGGSETFTYTLIQELQRRGHELSYFTTQTGIMSDRIEQDLGVFKTKGDPDLILANHHTTVDALSHLAPTIQTCHGIYPRLEQPSMKANAYVGISKEVCDYFRKKTGLFFTLIVNGVNLDRFRPVKPIRETLTKVLSLSHSEELNLQLKDIFKAKGIGFDSINKYKQQIFNIEDHINDCDMVVSLGRGAYESLACGRPVLILDQRPYGDRQVLGDGIIDPNTFRYPLRSNCSGRWYKRTDVKDMVDEAILRYDHSMQGYYRDLACNYFDIHKTVDQYQEVWERLI